MKAFKPQLNYSTPAMYNEWRQGNRKYRDCTEYFESYPKLKKRLKEILKTVKDLEDDLITVTRSKRGQWGEWVEKWQLIGGKPTITKETWN